MERPRHLETGARPAEIALQLDWLPSPKAECITATTGPSSSTHLQQNARQDAGEKVGCSLHHYVAICRQLLARRSVRLLRSRGGMPVHGVHNVSHSPSRCKVSLASTD
jgi:hypothetical protein